MKKGSYEFTLAKLLNSSELVSTWPNGIESHLHHEGPPSTKKLALIKMLIFHLYFANHFYPDCSVCVHSNRKFAIQTFPLRSTFSVTRCGTQRTVTAGSRRYHHSGCKEPFVCLQAGYVTSQLKYLKKFWPWSWEWPTYMISDREHPLWHHKSRDCDKAKKICTNRSLQPSPDILHLCW